MTVLESFPPLPPQLLTPMQPSSPLVMPKLPTSSPRKRKVELSLNGMDPGLPSGESGGSSAKQPSPAKKQKLAGKQAVRGRRKSRWKLKFHHQALPPEYLKHYKQQEKKRRDTENKNKIANEKAAGNKEFSPKDQEESLVSNDVALSLPNNEEDELSFLSSAGMQEPLPEDMRHLNQPMPEALWPTTLLGDNFSHLNIDLSQNKAFIENLLSNQIEINRVEKQEVVQKQPKPKKPKAIPSSGKIMNYSDLPYMGEITLDGVKPRRGRKPKKADICHLIYKNYGQVFPGAPNSVPEDPKERKWKAPTPRPPPPQPESPLPTVSGLLNHTEVQNRIINSLLERRLTQRARGKQEVKKSAVTPEEPLNLCLKDLQSLKIKLSRKHGNVYETKLPSSQEEIQIKKEVIDIESDATSVDDDSDLTPFNLVTTELRDSEDDDSVSLGSMSAQTTPSKILENSPESPMLPPDPMMFWPGGNFFYPPMPYMQDMYYPKPNAMKPPKTDKKPPKTKAKSHFKRQVPKGNQNTAQVVARRKRSAIFIPPVPAENTSNPTTEVSICKFKFTGGAKPSLQEKKMLSVDSGGNFRYYSGTGDKSMRGYEYFPRESLQQCQENTGCSPSGAFLTASALGSGEKIPEDVGHSGFFDTTFPLNVVPPKEEPVKKEMKRPSPFPVLKEHLMESREGDEEDSDSDPSVATSSSSRVDSKDEKRVRRSRKSLAREKLEQTFKEKGFLIQTQQLESAEGATYCKFRQLRKFTRYLFRSWKDYLPGNVRDMSELGEMEGLPAISPPIIAESP